MKNGILSYFNRYEGIFEDIDICFGDLIFRYSSSKSDIAFFIAAILSKSTREGHACRSIDEMIDEINSIDETRFEKEDILNILDNESFIGKPGEFKPIILNDNLVYLYRYFNYEENVKKELLYRAKTKAEEIGGLTPTLFTVITGGPGTGKTTMLSKILIEILKKDRNSKIALAAPTGKAAKRIQESIENSLRDTDYEFMSLIPKEAFTIHRLLGHKRNSINFRHNKENPLDYDVIVIDEASMIDLAMMSKILDALRGDARLVLLGDKDQLSSVELGSVFGDICNANNELSVCVKKLSKSYRFKENSGIGKFAFSVRDQDISKMLSCIKGLDDSFQLIDENEKKLKDILIKASEKFVKICNFTEVEDISKGLSSFIILTAMRNGRVGMNSVNFFIEESILSKLQKTVFNYGNERFFNGKPIMITVNDYNLGLFNGDIGFFVEREKKIYFPGNETYIDPAILPEHSMAFSITVHKSQGSEWDEVLFLLPEKNNQLITRELIYTAATRARENLSIYGKKDILKIAIMKKTWRNSGMKKW